MSKIRHGDLFLAQTRATLWHIFATVTAGNGIVKNVRTDMLFNHYGAQTVAALNDYWHHKVYLHRGTYELKVIYAKTVNSGIVDLGIFDPVNVSGYSLAFGSYDFYAAGTAVNQELTKSAITVLYDGLFHLYGQLNGKNASSGGYQAWMTCMEIYRTGD